MGDGVVGVDGGPTGVMGAEDCGVQEGVWNVAVRQSTGSETLHLHRLVMEFDSEEFGPVVMVSSLANLPRKHSNQPHLRPNSNRPTSDPTRPIATAR